MLSPTDHPGLVRSVSFPSQMSYCFAPGATVHWRGRLGIDIGSFPPPFGCEVLGKNSKFTTLRASCRNPKEDGSPTVAYLIDTCGFSPESAKRASKFVNFKTLDRPNSVLEFFKDQGFSESQVLTAVRRCPSLLMSDPEKTLLPKLEFFYSVGASASEVAELVCKRPIILTRSLSKTLVPAFNYYNGLFGCNVKTFHAMTRFGGVLGFDSGSSTACNVQVLRDCGVPEAKLLLLLNKKPLALNGNPGTFKSMVERVKEMGFDPTTTKFVDALMALESISESTWERKGEAYTRWGWSDEDLLRAFRLQPSCMLTSEEKIATVMNILVKEMGIQPSAVAKCPVIFGMSVSKRIRPRAAVAQALVSKGLLEKNFSLSKVFLCVESIFLEKFVDGFKDQVPDLLDLYKQKLEDT